MLLYCTCTCTCSLPVTISRIKKQFGEYNPPPNNYHFCNKKTTTHTHTHTHTQKYFKSGISRSRVPIRIWLASSTSSSVERTWKSMYVRRKTVYLMPIRFGLRLWILKFQTWNIPVCVCVFYLFFCYRNDNCF